MLRVLCAGVVLLVGCAGHSETVTACEWQPVASASYDLEADCQWSIRSLDVERVRLRSFDGECFGVNSCGCSGIDSLRPHELVELWSTLSGNEALAETFATPCHETPQTDPGGK